MMEATVAVYIDLMAASWLGLLALWLILVRAAILLPPPSGLKVYQRMWTVARWRQWALLME